MKKSNTNMLLLAAGAAAVGGYVLFKKKPSAVAGIPGVGALLPNVALLPASLRGQPSPVWLDALVWGGVGAAAGYYGLAGKKLPI